MTSTSPLEEAERGTVMVMADVDSSGGARSGRGRAFWMRMAALGGAVVLVGAAVTFGGIAYADARAQDKLEASQTAAREAVAACEATVKVERAAVIAGSTSAADAAPVAERVTDELSAVRAAQGALRDGADGACAQVVTEDVATNDQVVRDAAADAKRVTALSTALRADVETLAVAVVAAKLDVAVEGYEAVKAELAASIEAQAATAAAVAGQVSDQAALDALNAVIADARTLLDQAVSTEDLAAVSDATTALAGAGVALTDAATLVGTSHQSWLDAEAAAAAAAAQAAGGGSGKGSSGATGGGRTGSTGGGTTSGGGGSTGGGTTGGGTTAGGPGVVSWSTCDGYRQDKYIDGVRSGVARGCATVASATTEVAAYQNPGNGTCAAVGSLTADSPLTLASKASQYTYGRFTFTQANETQVKMTIESCLAP